MNATKKILQTIGLSIAFVTVFACSTSILPLGSAFASTSTSTPKPVTGEELTALALASADLPSGYLPLSGADLQDAIDLPTLVTAAFPNSPVYGFTAYGKKMDSGKWDALIVSFYFYPLTAQDIILFDDSSKAGKIFAHGAAMWECIDCGTGKYIGDYSANLTLPWEGISIDEVVGRRNNIGFAVLVEHGGARDKLEFAMDLARTLEKNIQPLSPSSNTTDGASATSASTLKLAGSKKAADLGIPIILGVKLREENSAEGLIIYQDFSFKDSEGDVTSIDFQVVSATVSGLTVFGGSVDVPADVQKLGGVTTGTWTCGGGAYTVTLQAILTDLLGNKSKPFNYTIACR
jgi:hypothetical protein